MAFIVPTVTPLPVSARAIFTHSDDRRRRVQPMEFPLVWSPKGQTRSAISKFITRPASHLRLGSQVTHPFTGQRGWVANLSKIQITIAFGEGTRRKLLCCGRAIWDRLRPLANGCKVHCYFNDRSWQGKVAGSHRMISGVAKLLTDVGNEFCDIGEPISSERPRRHLFQIVHVYPNWGLESCSNIGRVMEEGDLLSVLERVDDRTLIPPEKWKWNIGNLDK